MRRAVLILLLAGAGARLVADDLPSALLLNLAGDRPLFSYEVGATVQARSLAPGERARLEPGVFSGLGLKRVTLPAGTVSYLARVGAAASLYRLGAGQVLVVNQSGLAVFVDLAGSRSGSATLANGAFALADAPSGSAGLTWDDGTDAGASAELKAGGVYRLVLGSPDGTGTAVVLSPWD